MARRSTGLLHDRQLRVRGQNATGRRSRVKKDNGGTKGKTETGFVPGHDPAVASALGGARLRDLAAL